MHGKSSTSDACLVEVGDWPDAEGHNAFLATKCSQVAVHPHVHALLPLRLPLCQLHNKDSTDIP